MHCEVRYAVNVRAIIHVDPMVDGTGDVSAEWEIYDAEQDGDRVVLLADTVVKVSASTVQEAVELAKLQAPGVVGDGLEVSDVTLWVDESLDVQLIH